MIRKLKFIGFIIFGLLVLILIFLQFKEVFLIGQKVKKLEKKAVVIEQENKNLEREIAFWSNPVNIEKELRKQGFKRPDEEMILIIKPKDTTATTTNKDINNNFFDIFKKLFR